MPLSVLHPRQLYYLLSLQRSQWYSPSELEKLQNKKLRAITRYAYQNVQFYHQLFKSEGLTPEDITSVEDLKKLPILRKADVRGSFAELLSKEIRRMNCRQIRTSGSTGEPVTIVDEQRALWFAKYAIRIRNLFACGVRLNDRLAILWPFGRDELEHHRIPFFENLFVHRQLFSVFESVDAHLPAYQAFKPTVMFGFPSYFELLGRLIERERIEGIAPKKVFCNGELLTRSRRVFIERTLNTEVFDVYGSAEFKDVAWECPEHTGYHLNVESVVIEFIKDGEAVSPGEEGEIVLTNLHNRAMPLIRYTVGDVGTPSEDLCPCGRSLPLMEIVNGRTVDYVLLPNGEAISPYAFTCALEGFPNLFQYQVIQRTKEELLVKVIGDPHERRIIDKIQNMLGEKVTVEIEKVDEIPRDASGKYRVVKSEIPDARRSP